MCIAIPGKIIEIDEHIASVNIMGVVTNVNIQLISEPKIGDFVLVHTGCAIEKINKEYFNELTSLYSYLSNEDENG